MKIGLLFTVSLELGSLRYIGNIPCPAVPEQGQAHAKMNKQSNIAALLILLSCASAQSQTVGRLPVGDCSVMFKTSAIQDVRSAKWLGRCKDGLADGVGEYSLDYKNGSKSQYIGQMQNGRPNGGGKLTFGANVMTGDFVDGRMSNGKVSNTDGHVIFEGTLNPNGTFKIGKYYIGEAWLEGEFFESGLPDPFNGANIRSGTYFEKDGIPWYTFENGVKRDLQAERRAAEIARYQQAEAERRQREAQTTAILQAATQLINAYAQRSQGSSVASLATGESGRSASATPAGSLQTANNQSTQSSKASNRESTNDVQDCQPKIIAIQQRGDADKRASRGDAVGEARALYTASRRQKELFEGECSNHPQARSYVSSGQSGMSQWGARCQQAGGGYDCGVGSGSQNASNSSSQSSRRTENSDRNAHHPEGEANQCIRVNDRDEYGGFTNTCSYAISYIHCFANVQKDRVDTSFFHCERSGGLWSSGTTAGRLRSGGTDRTGMPIGGTVSWIACREPFSIRNAKFDGSRVTGSCVN